MINLDNLSRLFYCNKDNTVPSLERNFFEGVTTKTNDLSIKYMVMKSIGLR